DDDDDDDDDVSLFDADITQWLSALNTSHSPIHIIFYRHPMVSSFHLFLWLLSSSFIVCMVTVILFLSADFWTVKNITGWLMVGLRCEKVFSFLSAWWEFEAAGVRSKSRIFWLGLVMCPVIWVYFVYSTLFSFKIKCLAMVIMGVVLQEANLYGYVRCKVGGRTSLKNMSWSWVHLSHVQGPN
uniref:Golgi apparatus membrane protein TVP23 homolog n=1 Tax=Oncorhynchus mykiss TaxID=8022 RepID=A0A8C7WJT0_ONCMY